jgi:hypothetical protein
MLTMPAARRIAAALTAALVAVLLVTYGGPTRAEGHRAITADTSHAGSAAKSARVPQAVAPAHHQQTPQHLEIATTAPATASDVRSSVVAATPDAMVLRFGRDLVTPTGRAPPAL